MQKKGFTLIELLTVIMIISLLVAVVVVALNKSRVRARDARRKQDIQQVANGLQLYYQDKQSYPIAPIQPVEAWFDLSTAFSESLINGNYLSSIPKDPWIDDGYLYQYCSPTGDKYAVRARMELPSVDEITNETCLDSNSTVFKSGQYKVGTNPVKNYSSVSSGN